MVYLSRFQHSDSTFLYGSFACAGFSVLSAATPKASSRISPGCPHLRWEAASAGKDWMLKCGVSRAGPGREPLLAVQRQTEGMGVRGSVARNAPRRSVVYLGNEVQLLSGVQWAGSPLQPPSPPNGPCLCGHWEGLPPEQVHSSLLHLSTGLCCHRHSRKSQLWLLYPSPAWANKCPNQPETPNQLLLSPISPGKGTDAWGWPTCRGGAKTKAEPQGLYD